MIIFLARKLTYIPNTKLRDDLL